MPFSQCGDYRTKCYNKAWNLGFLGGVLWPELCVREDETAFKTVVHIQTPVGSLSLWPLGPRVSGGF